MAIFEPSNIVKNSDGYYYAAFAAVPKGKSIYTDRAICAMRMQTLADPTSWRAWDGTGFNLQMNDPFVAAATFCTLVGNPSPGIDQGLTYNTYLKKYLLVGGGAYFSLSTDFVNWIAMAPMGLPEPDPVVYATIIDHDDA